MKHSIKGLMVLAACLFAYSASSSAQTVAINGLGSSNLFLQLGQAASASTTGSPAGLGASCVWSTSTNNVVVATDNSTNGGGATDTGKAFVAWTPVSGSCTTAITSSTTIYAYISTDSVVGDRCLFNGCTIANKATAGTASAGLINGAANETPILASVLTALNASTANVVNAAGTDIRPEDAEFAISRALTSCGTAVAPGSQYLGLGYNNGDKIFSYYSSAAFNVINFSLPSAYSVTPIGVTPVVVVVNGDGTTNGFGDPGLTNITTGVLAQYLDGTFNQTQDALITPQVGSSEPVLTLIREPLSGTYNTMEYNVANTQPTKTSQDVGVNQISAAINCNGAAVLSNPMNLKAGPGFRRRAIGTGEELSESIIRTNSLAYGFWSVSNFKGYTNAAAPNAKYLTVDGVDPILDSYNSNASAPGTIPTTAAQIANVTLSNTKSGSYPIFSAIRLVNLGASATPAVSSLANAAQNFAPASIKPDFVPIGQLAINRSHFIPPAGAGQPTAASNGSGKACGSSEVGGDVGGLVVTKAGDFDFCYNYKNFTGVTGRRR